MEITFVHQLITSLWFTSKQKSCKLKQLLTFSIHPSCKKMKSHTEAMVKVFCTCCNLYMSTTLSCFAKRSGNSAPLLFAFYYGETHNVCRWVSFELGDLHHRFILEMFQVFHNSPISCYCRGVLSSSWRTPCFHPLLGRAQLPHRDGFVR